MQVLKYQAVSMVLILAVMWSRSLSFLHTSSPSAIFRDYAADAVIASSPRRDSDHIVGRNRSVGRVGVRLLGRRRRARVPWDEQSSLRARGDILFASHGLVNGLLITRLRVPPFIATLGLMGIARGFALIFPAGSRFSDWIKATCGLARASSSTWYRCDCHNDRRVRRRLSRRQLHAVRPLHLRDRSNAKRRASRHQRQLVTLGIYSICGLLCGVASIIEAVVSARFNPRAQRIRAPCHRRRRHRRDEHLRRRGQHRRRLSRRSYTT